MSDQPLDRPTSPSSRWLTNDEGRTSAASRRSSELAGPSKVEVQDIASEAPETTQQPHQHTSPFPPAHYPIDENLFYSAPTSQPLAQTRSNPSADYPSPREPNDEHEDQTYEDSTPSAPLLPPPNFRSFFPIIDDPSTNTHHHPTVHYTFSTDDPDLITSFALNALDVHHAPGQPRRNAQEERVIVVDLAADGKTVERVVSMSENWQAVKAEVTKAPSWGDKSGDDGEGGLMVRVEGREVRGALPKAAKGKAVSTTKKGDIEELVRMFGEKVEVLEDVVGRDLRVDGGGDGGVG